MLCVKVFFKYLPVAVPQLLIVSSVRRDCSRKETCCCLVTGSSVLEACLVLNCSRVCEKSGVRTPLYCDDTPACVLSGSLALGLSAVLSIKLNFGFCCRVSVEHPLIIQAFFF